MRALALLSLLGLTLFTACGDKDDTGGDGGASDGGASDGGASDGGASDGGADGGGDGGSDGGGDGGSDGGGDGGSDGGGDGGSDGGGDGGSDGGSSDGGVEDDADGDGWSIDDGDCDDGDPGVHPGAPDEPYDGQDTDCDGASDFDWDGDGFDSDEHGGRDCNDADADINPDGEDTPYDGVDTDCDGWSEYDADHDGHDAAVFGGEDCDDEDATVLPDGYDRPNDGIDQDCDGEDRVFDGVVLDEGGRATWTYIYELTGSGDVDVAVLLDTTCSMSSSLSSLDLEAIDLALAGSEADFAWGFATYDDYAYGSYGSAGSDKPFTMGHPVTDDLSGVQDIVEDASLHSGGDGPEATIEALYQALTGDGYDQGCDGDYDRYYDVMPFLASSDDPFGGAGGEHFDADVTGGGTRGGLGYRDGSTPILVYITDNYLRDPDAGYGSPGGCPLDAGSGDVVAAAAALDAWILPICVNSTYCVDQSEELAEAGGWVADIDGDGDEDPLAFTASGSTLNDTIAEAIGHALDNIDLTTVYDEIALTVHTDAYGLVLDIDPDPAEDVDTSVTDSVEFTVTFSGAVPATTEALDVTVTFDLSVNGEVVDTIAVDVEIPPAG